MNLQSPLQIKCNVSIITETQSLEPTNCCLCIETFNILSIQKMGRSDYGERAMFIQDLALLLAQPP